MCPSLSVSVRFWSSPSSVLRRASLIFTSFLSLYFALSLSLLFDLHCDFHGDLQTLRTVFCALSDSRCKLELNRNCCTHGLYLEVNFCLLLS